MTRTAALEWVSPALKLLALIALALAFVLPRWHAAVRLPPLAILLDRSQSMPANDVQKQYRKLQHLLDANEAAPRSTLLFAANTIVVDDNQASTDTAIAQAGAKLDAGNTDIAGAIVAGLARLPMRAAGELLVVSDGWSTQGDTEAALRLARDAGVLVHWLALGTPAPTIYLGAISGPVSARADAPFNVAVEVVASANRNIRLIAKLGSASEITLAATRVAAGRHTLWLPLRATGRGSQALEVRLLDADSGVELDAQSPATIVEVLGAPGVLYVAHGPTPLASSLRAGGWRVTEFQPAQLARAASLDDYALIVLDDVGQAEAPDSFWRALPQTIRGRGSSLLVLGGPRSFGAGGYRGTSLESLLPVTIERAREQQRVAVLFAIDKSGSMDSNTGGASRLAYARAAVLQTLRGLHPTDLAGVLAFDAAANMLVPFAPAPDAADALERIASLTPSGGTRAGNALLEGARQLAAQAAPQHVLVLATDGFLSDESLDTATSALRRGHVQFIGLGIGSPAQFAALRALASRLGGEVLEVGEAAELPRIMGAALDAGLAPIAHGPLAVHETAALPFTWQAAGPWPDVLNYSVTRLRNRADGLLESVRGEPLLAAQESGNGRVVVMPAGLGAWAPQWPRWNQWAQFSGALAGWLVGDNPDGRLTLRLRDQSGSLTATIDATEDGEWARGANATLAVTDPDGRDISATLEQIAPGRYETVIAANAPGRYQVQAQIGPLRVQRLWLRASSAERRQRGVNPQLQQWAQRGLLRLWPSSASPQLTVPWHGAPQLARAWLATGWVLFLLALLIDCRGVMIQVTAPLKRLAVRRRTQTSTSWLRASNAAKAPARQ